MSDRPSDEAGVLRAAGFAILRGGNPARPEQLAQSTGLAPAVVVEVLAAMSASGAAELDEDGRVVGIGGLSLVATRHQLELDGVALHTWCAVDALGIPPALGADAVARSRCAHCGESVAVSFRAGTPEAVAGVTDVTDVAVWFPRVAATNVRRDFCDVANLFCNGAHLDAWRRGAGNPPGDSLTLAEAEARGRVIWARDAQWAATADDASPRTAGS